MIPGNEGGIYRPTRDLPRGGILRLAAGSLPPADCPFVIGAGVGEQLTDISISRGIERGVAQPPEREREVGMALGHRVQQVLRERRIAVARREQTELASQACLIGGVEPLREAAERRLRLFYGLVLLVRKQRQQAFRNARQVPERDPRVIGVGVGALLVGGAENHRRG